MEWESIIKREIESDELDYKAAQNWHKLPRSGRAKFARHCMAMANTKGGYVVVGVGEDASGKPALYTGLTEEESQSFDPTEVGNFVNRFADPQVEFTIERPTVDEKRYVVFVIRRFSLLPHVCTCSCEHELIQGVFYIRTVDAASRPAYRSSEIHGIIQRAMRNQRELLGRMIRGLLYENHTVTPGAESQSHFTEELNHSRIFFNKFTRNEPGSVSLEFSVAPGDYIAERFTLSELRSHAEDACEFFPNSPFISTSELKEAYFTNVCFRFASKKHSWQLYRSGFFQFQRMIVPSKNRSIPYDLLLTFLSEAMYFSAHLYTSFGFNEETLQFGFLLNNAENLKLIFPGSAPGDFVCRIPEIKVRKNDSAVNLTSGLVDHTAWLISAVCERFNISEGRHKNLPAQIKKHLNLAS